MSDSRHHAEHYHPTVHKPGERARYAETRKITLIGAVVNVILAAAKIIFGIIGHSQSLIADGVHSLSDLASDGLVILAAKHGSQGADEDHPYGHARIETAFTVGLGILLIAVAIGLILDAVDRLFHPAYLLHPGVLALVVAAISVVAKEALYRYTLHVATKVRSNLLRANAWHHRSDAISSVVVIIGVAGSMAGLYYLDAVAAAGVGLMVAKIGWDLSWHSLKELVDTGLDPERIESIRNCILGVDGVRTLHMLRTRRMGQDALVDVHIMVPPKLSVSEGHYIGETVRSRLIREIDEVTDVMVHIDPEDDETKSPSLKLPMRSELMRRLANEWADMPVATQIERVTLHYLDGCVDVDLIFPFNVLGQGATYDQLRAEFGAVGARVEPVRNVALYFH